MVKVKLGKGNKWGFYSDSVKKDVTEIEKDKMPYNVLDILRNPKSKFEQQEGIAYNILNERILSIMPDLKTDDYGESVTLPFLLKDFEKAGLIKIKHNRGLNTRVKITRIGKQFINENVIEQ